MAEQTTGRGRSVSRLSGAPRRHVSLFVLKWQKLPQGPVLLQVGVVVALGFCGSQQRAVLRLLTKHRVGWMQICRPLQLWHNKPTAIPRASDKHPLRRAAQASPGRR